MSLQGVLVLNLIALALLLWVLNLIRHGRLYVGYGVITQAVQPIHLFRLTDGATLAETLNQSGYNADRPSDEWECAVGVEWKIVIPSVASQLERGANPSVLMLIGHSVAPFSRAPKMSMTAASKV